MKTIILCGGVGTRLKEETDFKPKAMVEVGGKPLIWHIMKLYNFYGFNDFVLALGYKSWMIKELFLNFKHRLNDFVLETEKDNIRVLSSQVDDFKITFVETGETTPTSGRILKCRKYLNDDEENFMVTYSDCVSNIDLDKLIAFHKKSGALGTITGVHPRSKYGLLKIDKYSKIKAFVEKPVLSDWINGGYMIYKNSDEVFSYFLKDEMDFVSCEKMSKEGKLFLHKHDGFWFAVDTFKELTDLNNIWESGNPPWKVW